MTRRDFLEAMGAALCCTEMGDVRYIFKDQLVETPNIDESVTDERPLAMLTIFRGKATLLPVTAMQFAVKVEFPSQPFENLPFYNWELRAETPIMPTGIASEQTCGFSCEFSEAGYSLGSLLAKATCEKITTSDGIQRWLFHFSGLATLDNPLLLSSI